MREKSAQRAAQIANWLPRARFFAAKGQGPVAVSIVDEAATAAGEVMLTLIDVHTAGETSRYWVPVDAATGADAATSLSFGRWLVESVLNRLSTTGRQGCFVGHPVGGFVAARPAGDVRVGVLAADASNTSLLVQSGSEGYVAKLIRHCQAGPQPEVEVGRFLATAAAWHETPPLVGWLAYEPADGSPATVVATLHAFFPGCRTAWDTFSSLIASGNLAGPSRDTILTTVAAIGRLTAAMHTALASQPDEPAFAATVPLPESCQAEAASMAAHARGVLARVAARAASWPEPIGGRLARVANQADQIAAGFAAVADPATLPAVIRVHGDYHLGQVLVREADGRVFPIDFEGEPTRPLEARRAKTSPAKDVAGMCRSFDYLLRHVAASGGPPYSRKTLVLFEQTFLDAYESLAAGQAWWPAAAERVLASWKLDKVIYELSYELDNRPDWVEVPLAALEDILAGAL